MRVSFAMLSTVVATSLGLAAQGSRDPWQSKFDLDRRQLVAHGASAYFVLDPGFHVVLENGNERLVIAALDDTRTIDGVVTRVVEERESKGGRLVEISRNFFARHLKTGDIFYFGEEVDIYKGERVVSHEGAWTAGVRGARVGLFIPGAPAEGARFYQEIAPGVAMDRVRILSTTVTATTPAGVFERCVRLEETTPLEPGVKDYKVFAPGIGIVQDGRLKLVRYGRSTGRS